MWLFVTMQTTLLLNIIFFIQNNFLYTKYININILIWEFSMALTFLCEIYPESFALCGSW